MKFFMTILILFFVWPTISRAADEPTLPVEEAAQLSPTYHDKVVVITGAASGIGRVLFLQLLQLGATVVGIDVSESGIRSLAGQALAFQQPGRLFSLKLADVTNEQEMGRVANEILEEYGQVDLLINNAGLGGVASLDEMDPQLMSRLVQVNTLGVTLLTSKLLPQFRRRSSEGRQSGVIFVSSMLSLFPVGGIEVYSGTKAYVNNFAAGLANEMASYRRFQVSVVYPPEVETPMIKAVDTGPDSFARQVMRSSPRLQAEEVSRAILHGYAQGKPRIIPGTMAKLGFFFGSVSPFRQCVLSFLNRRRRAYDR